MKTATLAVAVVACLSLAVPALGMIIDGSGTVTDWGVTPFTLPNQANQYQNGLSFTISNNYSPISYPGIGHEPSPGLASGGEACDLEEMYLRFSNNQLQILTVASSTGVPAYGNTFYLGDVFVTLGGQQFGIVTQAANQGLDAGSVYRISGAGDVVTLQAATGSYYGSTALVANDYGPPATIGSIAGPWAVKKTINSSLLLGSAAVKSATFDYGGAENGTFLFEYLVDLNTLGLAGGPWGTIKAHQTTGCGNDVIQVPEPATLGILATGTALCFLAARRKKAA